MSFEEDLRKAAEEGKSASANFYKFWSLYRESVIFPNFEQAATVLSDAFKNKGDAGYAELDEDNNAVVLYAAREKSGEPEYSLTFKADKEKREIVCSFDPEFAPEERFTLDRLTPEEVQQKVKEFVRAVADSRKAAARMAT